jgi:hypothetical protein
MPDRHISYVEADAPAGLTLVEWRRARNAASCRTRRRRLAFWARG